jgi:hypothetical protein
MRCFAPAILSRSATSLLEIGTRWPSFWSPLLQEQHSVVIIIDILTLTVPILPVWKVRRNDCDLPRCGEPKGVDEEEEFHEVVVGTLAATRLHHVDVMAAAVLAQLNARFLLNKYGLVQLSKCMRKIFLLCWQTF